MANSLLNEMYQLVERKSLGHQGKYYPADMIIEARGASVVEIRKWINLDESNPTNVGLHIVDMVSACVRVRSTIEGKTYSVKDLYEWDKIPLLLIIHGLSTLDSVSNNLYVQGTCSSSTCNKHFDKLVVQPSNIQYKPIPDKYDKYFDADEGIFKIATKNFGEIEHRPTTLGLGNAMMSWIQTFQPRFVAENQVMFNIVQFLSTDWRTASHKSLKLLQIEEFNLWTPAKLGLMIQLLTDLQGVVLGELSYICPDCGATFRCPMAFTRSYSKMFTTVSDIDDELC